MATSPTISCLFAPEAQALFDHFCGLLDIRIAFYDTEGVELLSGEARRTSCTYCRDLREKLGLEKLCLELDRKMRLEAAKKREMVHYECHGGMTEAIQPVFDSTGLLGYVMIGQFRLRETVPEGICAWAARRRLENEIGAAFQQAPYIDSRQLPHVLGLFSTLVMYIQTQALVRSQSREMAVLRTILVWLDAHPQARLTAKEGAAMIHRSPATLARICRSCYGKGFRQMQIGRKLDQAERWLTENGDFTVQEIAARLGFSDALYFSRLFKKHKGVTPSHYARKAVAPTTPSHPDPLHC
jgi:AraC-like DNA-binding protein